MNRKNSYCDPEPIHEYIYSTTELNQEELAQALDSILEHLNLNLYRTNRNKHSELRIEVRSRDR